MSKPSLGDKLKVIFSPEKGKSILDYLYKDVLLPTAKNTAYNMCQIAVAKFFDVDVSTVNTIGTNGRTPYSKVNTSTTRQPDKPSYLPAESHAHNDITWIPFDTAHEASKLIDFMDAKIKGAKRYCSVADIYEELQWRGEIVQSDFDIGWKSTMGIGVVCRNGVYFISAPYATRIG